MRAHVIQLTQRLAPSAIVGLLFAAPALPAWAVSGDGVQVHPEMMAEGDLELVILATPTARTHTEGESVRVTTIAAPQDGVTFSAEGLPPDLRIDAATGVISGKLGGRAAGHHQVSVTARAPTRSERVRFSWAVLEATLPEVGSPGTVVNTAGDAVTLALPARDADAETLLFAATGLPEGLRIDTSTGVVSGQIAVHDLRTTYTVVVTASDGHVSGGTVFAWVVLPSD